MLDKNPEGTQNRDFHRVKLEVSHTNNGFLGIIYYKYIWGLSMLLELLFLCGLLLARFMIPVAFFFILSKIFIYLPRAIL